MGAAVATVAASDLMATVLAGMIPLPSSAAGIITAVPPVPLDPVGFEMLWHRQADANSARRWFRDLVRREASAVMPCAPAELATADGGHGR